MKKPVTMIGGERAALDPVNTFVKIDQVEGKEVVRVTKDPKVEAVDEPTFAKLIGSDFKNGIIEVTVLSKLLENAPTSLVDLSALLFGLTRVTQNSKAFISARPMEEPMISCEEIAPRSISPILISSLIASEMNLLECMNHMQTWGLTS